MREISLLIKPASGFCNMECSYCFYKEELSHLEHPQAGMMSHEVAATLIWRACEEAEELIHFSFQGGEPTLAGLQFFQEFVSLVESCRKRKTRIRYAIQTNGLLVDEKWARFFFENHFLVGLSYDGNPWTHDFFRKEKNGGRTARKVEAAWKILQEHHVETNLLCVVTKQIAKKPGDAYAFLKGIGARYLQFIPCIAPKGGETAFRWGLGTTEYAYFLKSLFDYWYRDWKTGHYISVRNFDDYVNLMCHRRPSTCAACGQCGRYLVVEADGSTYPCDFYVEDLWYLGNLMEQSLEQLLNSQKAMDFAAETYRPKQCGQCRYYWICRGGCKNDYRGGAQNRFCAAYQDFFSYAMDRLQQIAAEEWRITGGGQ